MSTNGQKFKWGKLAGKREELLKLWTDGASTKEIAEHFGLAQNYIRAVLKELGQDTSRKPMQDLKPLSETEKAYIAGVLDGEGYIGARRISQHNRSSDSWTVQQLVIVGSTYRPLIDYLFSLTGVGSIRANVKTNKNNERNAKWKPMHYVTWTSWGGTELLESVLPYLQVKHEQAELFIELSDLKTKSTPQGKHRPDRQLEIVEAIRALNKRGWDA